jgi:hypothetical protein
MRTQGLFILLFVFSLVLLEGCTEQLTNRSYTNTMYSFSFDPPAGWQQTQSKSPDVAVCFIPEDSSNVLLTIGVPFPLGEGRALSTFADQVEQNLSESGLNFTVLFRDWRSIPNLQAYEIIYTYEQDGAREYVKQVAVLRTRTVFLITFTAPDTVVLQYLTAVDQSIDTFL